MEEMPRYILQLVNRERKIEITMSDKEKKIKRKGPPQFGLLLLHIAGVLLRVRTKQYNV